MQDKNKKINTGAVIVAAGESRRMSGTNKVFALLAGRPVLSRVIDTFEACESIDRIVLVFSKKNLEKGKTLVVEGNWHKVKGVCLGGERRQDSVLAGLEYLGDCNMVVIHDGARPLITTELITNGLAAARETGAAIAAVPVTDTIKIAGNDKIIQGTPPRQNLWAAQTPQVFRYRMITRGYREMISDITDDASVVEFTGGKVKLYMGSYDNIKITTPDDLAQAEMLLKKKNGR